MFTLHMLASQIEDNGYPFEFLFIVMKIDTIDCNELNKTKFALLKDNRVMKAK